jgi:hypothetical protein
MGNKMEIKKKLMKREIAGDTFLVPLGKTVYDANGLFFLTEVGAFIWDLLPEAKTEEDVLSAVLEEYDVDEATARQDVHSFLEKLRGMNII